MRSLVAAGAGLAVAATLSLLPVSRALACSCVGWSEREAFEAAAAVFDGVVISSSGPPILPIQSSGDPVDYTITVEKALKGNLPSDQVTVTSALYGASCGVEFQVGERWRVFADSSDGGLQANLCGGSRLLDESVPLPAPTGDGDASPQAGVLLPILVGFGVIGMLVAAVLLVVRGRA